jgi:hypothetical protein
MRCLRIHHTGRPAVQDFLLRSAIFCAVPGSRKIAVMIRCVCGAAQKAKYSRQRRASLHPLGKLPHGSSGRSKTMTIMIEKDD